MFALVIGIDTYKSKDIRPLRGAVADARAFTTYLQDERSVPRDHLVILINEAASRLAILEGFRRLANDTRIRHGDPILVYFAGHGSEVHAPQRWESGRPGAKVQCILPHDAYFDSGDEMVAPIPDHTLGALLDAISQEKGNNIVSSDKISSLYVSMIIDLPKCVVMDSCYATISGTRSLTSDDVRSVSVPSNFKLQENLDRDIWSLSPSSGGLRSHVLLSACSSSGQAWESNGRGVFTAALLDLLEVSQTDRLRYCNIVMSLDIFGQNPQCEGFYRERYMFTTKSSLAEYFIPACTRISMEDTAETYVLNGGSAHGLSVGDEFAVYGHMDSAKPNGTLVVKQPGSFHSIMELLGPPPVLSSTVIARRLKPGRRQPLRIHIPAEDKVSEILSLLPDIAPDLLDFVLVDTPGNSQIDISVQGEQAIVLSKGMNSAQGFRLEATPSELSRVLNASWRFFSELDRTADFPGIAQRVQVNIYELQVSATRFPGAPISELHSSSPVPSENDSFILRQGTSYGLKLTNTGCYDLHPTVQYFDPSNEFKFGMLVLNTKRRALI